ncbi:class I adenylate-forming enzyme family protein [Actinomadura sp. DC4]|uniref:class I adenylate-forming enzyme family protein n=1 Tax=Actinomadura sp. DC4 TaxID=3055069 RepID=UPI0025B0B07D|nr:class I adenylate-forming enzyme family protein [Actinomadura sp. DC4]MDN3357585.1 class I adenylate-forming enzyme family protein [Actinomadura sp. DC4]
MPEGSAAMAELFAAVLDTHADGAALVETGRTLTFGRWWEESGRVASGLAELGAGPGDVVALHLPSGFDFACCHLGALRLGAVVSGVNPRLGRTEVGHILGRARPAVLITGTPEAVPFDGTARTPAELAGPPGAVPSVEGVRAVPCDAPAVIVWTTGTTGLPKGAWFDHRALRFIAENLGPLSAPYDRKLMPVPFAHAGYLTRIYDQLIHRSALVLTPPVWTAEAMLDVLVRERVTVGQGVPAQWEKLIRLDRLADADLSRLRLVATGASRVPASLVTAMRERLGCPVVVRYASTELPLAFGTGVGDPPEIVATTVGRPLAGVEAEIRSPAGEPVAPGTTGRVALRSPGAMRGYWHDPGRTARTLSPDGWITTNDLGSLDAAGNLTVVGRADDVYIRGGYNIHPAEVEAALLAHPGVARAAVVGTPAPVIGEIGVAFVVPASASCPAADELRAWCGERIADYKRPDVVVFVDDLPVNATFKVDVTRLRALAARAVARAG